MTVHRADWVLPIASPPVRGGWVAVAGGRVAGCGEPATAPVGARLANPFDGQPCALLPALVNAHTHLELSYLAGQVMPGPSCGEWGTSLVALRRCHTAPQAPKIVDAARAAISEARRFGTGLVGDVSNTLTTIPLLREARLHGRVFHELLGFTAAEAAVTVAAGRSRLGAHQTSGFLRSNITPHAPYSVSPALFAEIGGALAANADAVASVHLGESPEEIEFLRSGDGAIRIALEKMGVWNPSWPVPGCGPIEYMDRFGLLHARLIAVHGVQLADGELALLRDAGASLVTCPRSNRWVGVGDPDVARFYASGVRVAIGTDSLASVDDLNVFAEMARIRVLAPAVPASAVLDSATRQGAEALGLGADFGTLEPGKQASMIAVRIPEGVSDVEEYLLSGIQLPDIAWVAGEHLDLGR